MSLTSASSFVGGAVLGQFLFEKCFRFTRVEGPSMEPLLQKDDRIFGVSPAFFVAAFKVQDFVSQTLYASSSSISAPSSTSGTIVSRCWNNRVVVCEMSPGMLYCKLTRVPHGAVNISSLDLRGINSRASRDSREFGELPLSSVKSVALCKVWPSFDWFLNRSFEIRE